MLRDNQNNLIYQGLNNGIYSNPPYQNNLNYGLYQNNQNFYQQPPVPQVLQNPNQLLQNNLVQQMDPYEQERISMYYKESLSLLCIVVIIDCMVCITVQVQFIYNLYGLCEVLMILQTLVFFIVMSLTCTSSKFSKKTLERVRNLELGFIVSYFLMGAILTVVEYFRVGESKDFFDKSLLFCLSTIIFIIPQFIALMAIKPKKASRPGPF